MHKHATSNYSITLYLLQDLVKSTDDAMTSNSRKKNFTQYLWLEMHLHWERIHNGPISAQN